MPAVAPGAAASKGVPAIRRPVVAGIALLAVLVSLCGWSGYRLHADRSAAALREQFVDIGRRAATDLTTLDYQQAETDVRRVLDSATGQLYSDFSGRSSTLIDVARRAQSVSVGTVTEAGLESFNGNEGRVLVALTVTTRNFSIADLPARYFRMRLTVVTVDGVPKVSKVEYLT